MLENGHENRGYETCGVFEGALFSFSVWSALVINLFAKFSTQPCEILSCTDKLDWNQLFDYLEEAIPEVVLVAAYIHVVGSRQEVVS